jgi:LysR family glycine cleavage system transcriptional activator
MPAATISPWCATCLSDLSLALTGRCNASGQARLRSARHRIFAAKWLVSRLGRFAEAYPEIELNLAALMHRVDFAREDVDLAIRHGDGQWPELDAVNLCTEELFPVCSPSLMTVRGGLREPEDVLRFPLLHLDDRRDWSR